MNDSPHSKNPFVSKASLTGSAQLTNDVGLHARPSVKLTQLAKSFDASIEFALDATGPWVDAKSPVKVMRFKAAKGATLHFRAHGPDAAVALTALLALIEGGFAIDGEASLRQPNA